MRQSRLHRIAGIAHKWAGITVGIQVLLWIFGGLVMSWYDIERVRGEHLVTESDEAPLAADSFDPEALMTFVTGSERPVLSAAAVNLHGRPVFRIDYAGGGTAVLDAESGRILTPFDEAFIRKAARHVYTGRGDIVSARLLEKAGVEYRGGALPVWKVDFDDPQGTSLYFPAGTGELRAVRTDLWRFYDVMWMLHIMDYDDRTDFNHPLLYLFALAALIFTLSGFVLAWYRFQRRDFAWLLPGRKGAKNPARRPDGGDKS